MRVADLMETLDVANATDVRTSFSLREDTWTVHLTRDRVTTTGTGQSFEEAMVEAALEAHIGDHDYRAPMNAPGLTGAQLRAWRAELYGRVQLTPTGEYRGEYRPYEP
ncbi:hypothetical protein [Deinococcus soli (ex Cha et al. 2016)]|uniref:Uncharacterized protein n=2 Tax=Deinococcus soli (ex Cha et al. 2016) TaxID=1309411 RepID=A0ACC6KKU0_9DEIO|nr:hypothetical protein [Deinococcus soli (ex Cha et al. 2016)]MDR6218666.1 hypothetical protein [Deinococcus soli (ex Cha et al. 2016)]MDR6328463.1 hypothetical protein [Deinococcus soli (ex Cha et al. 2016)]MDR6753074.1 hypothetical protein [Deinococcus soli (ex Cha et al. 2016)]